VLPWPQERKAKSRILAGAHATARDPHRLGFIDKLKMRKFVHRTNPNAFMPPIVPNIAPITSPQRRLN
jgi:hypothetical protein